MVSTVRFVACLAVVLLMVGCGTLEDNAWTSGVSREEALEFRQFIFATKGAHEVYGYARGYDGGIIISTDVGAWSGRKVHGKWVLTEVAFVS
jgi:hypothetical protein